MKGTKPVKQENNVVNQNIIHRENLKNELKYLDVNRTEHFQLNPHNGKFEISQSSQTNIQLG